MISLFFTLAATAACGGVAFDPPANGSTDGGAVSDGGAPGSGSVTSGSGSTRPSVRTSADAGASTLPEGGSDGVPVSTTTECGIVGTACCADNVCGAGATCTTIGCIACGEPGEACCDAPSGGCTSDTSCFTLNGFSYCAAYGSDSTAGETCVYTNTCPSGYVCPSDVGSCLACGGFGQDCCDGSTCSAGYACEGNYCQ